MGTWTHSVARNRKQTTKSTSETNAAKDDNDDKEMTKKWNDEKKKIYIYRPMFNVSLLQAKICNKAKTKISLKLKQKRKRETETERKNKTKCLPL